LMGAMLISLLDLDKAPYPSSFWAYAGLDVAPDGKRRSRRKPHLIPREYLTKTGGIRTRLSLTYNPFLKARLMGGLGPSLLRTKNETYGAVYLERRGRLEVVEEPEIWKHNDALGVMLKAFLKDLWVNWRRVGDAPNGFDIVNRNSGSGRTANRRR
jgi:hypothetical protein